MYIDSRVTIVQDTFSCASWALSLKSAIHTYIFYTYVGNKVILYIYVQCTHIFDQFTFKKNIYTFNLFFNIFFCTILHYSYCFSLKN